MQASPSPLTLGINNECPSVAGTVPNPQALKAAKLAFIGAVLLVIPGVHKCRLMSS